MAIIFDKFKVIDFDEQTGHILLEWYVSTDPTVQKLVRNHKIPIEAELNNWTEAQYRAYFSNEVEDMAVIPEWAKAEAEKEYLVRKRRPAR